MPIGRNDPCPCGSGKKYKRCHGAPEFRPPVPAEVARANELKTRDTQLTDRLLRFARSRHGPHWLHDVLGEAHLLDDDGDLPHGELSIVIPWLLHHRAGAVGWTIAREWRHEQRRIEPDDDLLLDAYAAAWISIWEVGEVQTGRGSWLTDNLTGRQQFIEDVSSTATLHRFDTLLGIPILCDGVSFFGGLHTQPLPPRFGTAATRAAKHLCRVRTRRVAPEKLREPEMELSMMLLWRAAVERMLDQPPPVLQTTDGEPLVLTRDDFALVAARDSIIQAVAALPGVQEPEQEDGETLFVVTKSGNAMHRSWTNTVIGRIVVKKDRLVTETMSTGRADTLRATIEEGLPGAVRFRLRTEESAAHLLGSASESSAGRRRPWEHRAPEVVDEVRRFRQEHMTEWVDQQLPALDGLTPREAARLPRVRPKLELLLKEFEQYETRLPEDQRIDVATLWETLGLARP